MRSRLPTSNQRQGFASHDSLNRRRLLQFWRIVPVALALGTLSTTLGVATPAGASGSPIAVGNNPVGVAVDPSTNTVYVANAGDDTVSVINGATDKVTATVTVGYGSSGVAVNPLTNTVYVANSSADSIQLIIGTIDEDNIGVPDIATGIAVDPSTNNTYFTNGLDDTVSVLNLATPGAPNLTKAAAGSGTIMLKWKAPSVTGSCTGSDYECSASSINYDIFVGTASNKELLTVTTGSNATTYVLKRLKKGVKYYVEVRALNEVGLGADSNQLSATVK